VRLFAAAALGLVFFVASAELADAKRPATAAEAKAVQAAVAVYVATPKSPAAKDNRVSSVSISSANAAYALAKLTSKSAGPSNALLHRVGATWKVVDFGSGAFPCKDATAKVLKDLLGGCVPG
jgi:hypothetical protein